MTRSRSDQQGLWDLELSSNQFIVQPWGIDVDAQFGPLTLGTDEYTGDLVAHIEFVPPEAGDAKGQSTFSLDYDHQRQRFLLCSGEINAKKQCKPDGSYVRTITSSGSFERTAFGRGTFDVEVNLLESLMYEGGPLHVVWRTATDLAAYEGQDVIMDVRVDAHDLAIDAVPELRDATMDVLFSGVTGPKVVDVQSLGGRNVSVTIESAQAGPYEVHGTWIHNTTAEHVGALLETTFASEGGTGLVKFLHSDGATSMVVDKGWLEDYAARVDIETTSQEDRFFVNLQGDLLQEATLLAGEEDARLDVRWPGNPAAYDGSPGYVDLDMTGLSPSLAELDVAFGPLRGPLNVTYHGGRYLGCDDGASCHDLDVILTKAETVPITVDAKSYQASQHRTFSLETGEHETFYDRMHEIKLDFALQATPGAGGSQLSASYRDDDVSGIQVDMLAGALTDLDARYTRHESLPGSIIIQRHLNASVGYLQSFGASWGAETPTTNPWQVTYASPDAVHGYPGTTLEFDAIAEGWLGDFEITCNLLNIQDGMTIEAWGDLVRQPPDLHAQMRLDGSPSAKLECAVPAAVPTLDVEWFGAQDAGTLLQVDVEGQLGGGNAPTGDDETDMCKPHDFEQTPAAQEPGALTAELTTEGGYIKSYDLIVGRECPGKLAISGRNLASLAFSSGGSVGDAPVTRFTYLAPTIEPFISDDSTSSDVLLNFGRCTGLRADGLNSLVFERRGANLKESEFSISELNLDWEGGIHVVGCEVDVSDANATVRRHAVVTGNVVTLNIHRGDHLWWWNGHPCSHRSYSLKAYWSPGWILSDGFVNPSWDEYEDAWASYDGPWEEYDETWKEHKELWNRWENVSASWPDFLADPTNFYYNQGLWDAFMDDWDQFAAWDRATESYDDTPKSTIRMIRGYGFENVPFHGRWTLWADIGENFVSDPSLAESIGDADRNSPIGTVTATGPIPRNDGDPAMDSFDPECGT